MFWSKLHIWSQTEEWPYIGLLNIEFSFLKRHMCWPMVDLKSKTGVFLGKKIKDNIFFKVHGHKSGFLVLKKRW